MALNIDQLVSQGNREIADLYVALQREQQEQLPELDSPSQTAIYKVLLYIFAVLSWLQTNRWAQAEQQLITAARSAEQGNAYWLAQTALAFRDGATISLNTETYRYEYVSDAGQRVIDRVSVSTADATTTLKLAKSGTEGLQPLSASQLTAFQSYISRQQWAGTRINVVSLPADELWVQADVYYDANIQSADDLRADLDAAVNDFFENIGFDGRFLVSAYVDAIQSIPGVVDVQTILVQARPNGGTFERVDRVYDPASGYFVQPDGKRISETVQLFSA